MQGLGFEGLQGFGLGFRVGRVGGACGFVGFLGFVGVWVWGLVGRKGIGPGSLGSSGLEGSGFHSMFGFFLILVLVG